MSGYVMAVGGAEDKIRKRTVLMEFVRRAGGDAARIVIIPAASAEPDERGALYAGIFNELGAASSVVLTISNRHDANEQAVAAAIDDATGVFITGGIQLRLISLLGGTDAGRAIGDVVQRGGIYCGTSAGAAAVSSHMIVTGTSGMRVRRAMVDLAPGLGLVSGVILDQHFSQRGRFGRLIAAVGMNPELLGIGVDEDTAAIFGERNEFEVIGTSQVAVIDASHVLRTNIHTIAKSKPFSMSGLRLHLLTAGDRFDLTKREVIL